MKEENILSVIKEISSSVKKDIYLDWVDLIRKIEKLYISGIPTPALSVCGRGTQEIRFTKYFAYYLNQDKLHGMKDQFLKSVLRNEAEECGLQIDWHRDCRVFTEYNLGKVEGSNHFNIIDIVIKGIDFNVFIEQKILSGESNFVEDSLSQLERYGEAIDNKFGQEGQKVIKIYLTPNGSLPSHSKGWIPLSHEDIIRRALRLLNNASLSPVAKNNLCTLLMDFLTGSEFQYYEEVIRTVSESIKEYDNCTDIPIHKMLHLFEVVEKNKLFFEIWSGGDFSNEKVI